jgi:hypothetical protein
VHSGGGRSDNPEVDEIVSPLLWLRAEEGLGVNSGAALTDGVSVSSWTSKEGNSHVASGAFGSNTDVMPTFAAGSSLSITSGGLNFGTSSYLQLHVGAATSSNMSVVMVVSGGGTAQAAQKLLDVSAVTDGLLLMFANEANAAVFGPASAGVSGTFYDVETPGNTVSATEGLHVLTFVGQDASGDAKLYIDTTLSGNGVFAQAAAATGTWGGGEITIGSSQNNGFQGLIFEVIVVGERLNAVQRDMLVKNLLERYV